MLAVPRKQNSNLRVNGYTP